jgi:hypothetical protein
MQLVIESRLAGGETGSQGTRVAHGLNLEPWESLVTLTPEVKK